MNVYNFIKNSCPTLQELCMDKTTFFKTQNWFGVSLNVRPPEIIITLPVGKAFILIKHKIREFKYPRTIKNHLYNR